MLYVLQMRAAFMSHVVNLYATYMHYVLCIVYVFHVD